MRRTKEEAILQPVKQSRIEASDARFDFLDMPHQLIENKAMAVGHFALQGIKDIFPAVLESPTGKLEDFVGRLPKNEGFDHGACRLTVKIADHHAETNAAIGQHLVQAVLLRSQLPDQFLPLSRDQT